MGYYAGDNEFHSFAPKTVAPPECGFLFPAFDGRAANLYNALFYCRKAGELPEAFLDSVFHTGIPMTAQEQKESFQEALAESLGADCSMEVVQAIHGQLTELIEDHKQRKDPEPLTVTAKDITRILEDCQVPQEQVAAFQQLCGEHFGEGAAMDPANLIDPGKVEIKTPQVSVTVDSDASYLVESRVIDGQKYLLIPAGEGVEFNGLAVRIPYEKQPELPESNA